MNLDDYCNKHNLIDTNIIRDLKWLACDYLNCGLFELKDKIIDGVAEKFLDNGLKELKKQTPLAYVTKKAPFFGTNFFVDKNVLIPRMETEQLLELIIKENKHRHNLKILDMCTGSGCIAIILKKHLDCSLTAVDVSAQALKIAQKNAKLHNAEICFIKSDMFDKIDDKYDIIVSNPPYIATNEIETLDNAVKDYEPKKALDGGKDGLDFYRVIADNAPNFLKTRGLLYLEIGHNQGKSVSKLLDKNFEDVLVIKDYDKHDRIVRCIRR
ncbi:MAG: peptide chain release factor N(5)-glutamine methyltransferase [Clostridia bacterium]|nr:peptide chain release factor N(5)-glutamine methyltransferase [Clostridia bacterium]